MSVEDDISSQGDSKSQCDIYIDDIEQSIKSLKQTEFLDEQPASVRTEVFIHRNRSVLFTLKIALVVALLAIAGGAGFLAYHFTRAKEVAAFQTSFEEDSEHLINYAQEISMWTQLAAMGFTYDITAALSNTLPLIESQQQPLWPFVTNYQFGAISFPALHQSTAKNIVMSPIIQNEEILKEWENYAVTARPLVQNISSTGNRSIADGIYRLDDCGKPVNDLVGPAPYVPIWHVAPQSEQNNLIMFNQASDPMQRTAINDMVATKSQITSEVYIPEIGGEPQFFSFFPIFDNLSRDNVVASLSLLSEASSLFDTKLSSQNTNVLIVLENLCGQIYTYEVVGEGVVAHEHLDSRVRFLGEGDRHDARYDDFQTTVTFQQSLAAWKEFLKDIPPELAVFFFDEYTERDNVTSCGIFITVYPTQEYEDVFLTKDPLALGLGIAMAIVATAVIFLAYVIYVERRQGALLKRVRRSNETNGALVESFFPSVVRDRVRSSFHAKSPNIKNSPIKARRNYEPDHFAPIAEQFQNTTVFFADIVGFTAWSSQREPEQVFTLLETLYEQFDVLAKRMGVYKVETIGDCYMAVVGLPEVNLHHALVTARFAHECIVSTAAITKTLEASLGPGTSKLGLRIGLHSGTVTGGVLRGEKSRFQLFGDTVNTAARMESNGVTGRVQVSQATADLIIAAGKSHWLKPRRTLVKAKGKGEMQTYFVKPRRRRPGLTKSALKSSEISLLPMSPPTTDDEVSIPEEHIPCLNDETTHDWGSNSSASGTTSPLLDRDDSLIEWNTDNLLLCLLSNERIGTSSYGHAFCEYKATVRTQLHALITHLSTLYPDLPYHNFEHASVNAMFADKLMKEAITAMRAEQGGCLVFEQFYGIVHFTAVFAVLVRDIQYRAAVNTVDVISIVVDKLKTNSYDALFFALCGSEGSTFEVVFCDCLKAPHTMPSRSTIVPQKTEPCTKRPPALLPDRMLEIVRLVIRSSDVSHWLQHWNTFSTWHRRLFNEIHTKSVTGERNYDPSKSWVQDELGFFDNCVLPLAKELEANGFGGEYLARAEENHREWVVTGQQVTEGLIV